MLLELKKDNLKEVIKGKEKVIAMFKADWHGTCILLKKQLQKLASENNHYHFLLIDVEKQPLSCRMANVKQIPAFVTLDEGALSSPVYSSNLNFIKKELEEEQSVYVEEVIDKSFSLS